MPISDITPYLGSVVAVGFRGRLRALWTRIRHNDTDSVEGYRVDGMK